MVEVDPRRVTWSALPTSDPVDIDADRREGEVVWRRNLSEGQDIKVRLRLLQAPDGGYLIVGQVDQGRGFGTMLIKVDSEGQVAE